jgi:hypothetical protein
MHVASAAGIAFARFCALDRRPRGGVYVGVSGTISGGTLATVGAGAAINVQLAGNVFSGVTIAAGSLVEVVAGGSLTLSGTTSNAGTIIASGASSFIDIASAGIVSGGVVEVGNGVVDVLSGGKANIAFVTNDSGGLEIADSAGHVSAFAGTVSGFGGSSHNNPNQHIDLTSVTSAGTIAVSYTSASGNKSGTLDVLSNSTLVAAIQMIGAYSAGNFHVTAGQGGAVEITDPAVVAGGGSVQSANLALFGNYIAGSFVTAGGWQGGTSIAAAPASEHILAAPHGG